jgi:hypothetical protein
MSEAWCDPEGSKSLLLFFLYRRPQTGQYTGVLVQELRLEVAWMSGCFCSNVCSTPYEASFFGLLYIPLSSKSLTHRGARSCCPIKHPIWILVNVRQFLQSNTRQNVARKKRIDDNADKLGVTWHGDVLCDARALLNGEGIPPH